MCWKWSKNTQYTLLLSVLYWAINYDSVQTSEHMSIKREAWGVVLPRHSGVLPGTFLKNHSIIQWLYKYPVLRWNILLSPGTESFAIAQYTILSHKLGKIWKFRVWNQVFVKYLKKRFYDLQNLTLFKRRKKQDILEPLHKKIAQPLFLLHFQHIVQWDTLTIDRTDWLKREN